MIKFIINKENEYGILLVYMYILLNYINVDILIVYV